MYWPAHRRGATRLRQWGSNASTVGWQRLHEGDVVTLDGKSGRIGAGMLPLARERPNAELAELARWRREQG
jgi:hypothetical protein